MLRKQFDHVRKARQRLYRGIPRLGVHGGKVASFHRLRVACDPILRLEDLVVESARREDQGEQGIRIECNRAQQIFEIGERVAADGLVSAGLCWCLRCLRRRWRCRLRECRVNRACPHQHDSHCKSRPPSGQDRTVIEQRSHQDFLQGAPAVRFRRETRNQAIGWSTIRNLRSRYRSVRFVTASARLSPIWPSTDNGCNVIVRRHPPTNTLAPKPRPTATFPLAPTYSPLRVRGPTRPLRAKTPQESVPPRVTPTSTPTRLILPE